MSQTEEYWSLFIFLEPYLEVQEGGQTTKFKIEFRWWIRGNGSGERAARRSDMGELLSQKLREGKDQGQKQKSKELREAEDQSR